MKIQEGEHILYAECSSHEQAIMLANMKFHQGWEVVVMPWPTAFEEVDRGEETTFPVPTVWSLLMHRKPVKKTVNGG